MNWKPAKKRITGLQTIRVAHPLTHEGGTLSYASPLLFSWKDLVLSLVRTTTLQSAVPNLSQEERIWLAHSNAACHAERINLFVSPRNAEFSVTTKVDILPDEDLTSLAAKMGVAVADLVMERLGFHWRANVLEIELSPSVGDPDSKKRRPDFVYDPAGKYGFQPKSVVVAEAKGSLSRVRAKRAAIRTLSRKAFAEQVQHVIGQPARDVIVAGGYGIAFGAIQGDHAPGAVGEQVSTLAVASPESIAVVAAKAKTKVNSLSAAATYGPRQVQKIQVQQVPQRQQQQEELRRQLEQRRHGPRGPGGPGGPTDGGPRREREQRTASGRIAYANYESAFLLCGADIAAGFLRNILDGRGVADIGPDRSIQEFWVVNHSSGPFWTSSSRGVPWWPWWGREPLLFGIHETSAKEILRSVANNLERVPDTVNLTVAPIEVGSEPDADLDIAIQGDGLALFSDPRLRPERRYWDLRKGELL
ncbi:hypothetical protein EI171_39875 [Bradyrhizobium sp. LCT2]|uniref:hypothetical protein n=1 Tax=Bradyrhizobium sp. LCT2 TaxID=2493093 RepID=UPI00137437F2|nr:hypothetical protein [Bradyrhizobium sp. LCT2]QHP72946.1 hypothetical protein EI171_39875 [Bradyrhizobium sp. LCT2]